MRSSPYPRQDAVLTLNGRSPARFRTEALSSILHKLVPVRETARSGNLALLPDCPLDNMFMSWITESKGRTAHAPGVQGGDAMGD